MFFQNENYSNKKQKQMTENDPNFVPKYLLKEDEDNLGDVIGDIFFGLTNPVIVEAMDGTFDVLKCQSYVFLQRRVGKYVL